MIFSGDLLNQTNLNNAYISKTAISDQTVSSNLKVGGGKITLKNSILSDSLGNYLQVNPQGSMVIVYDGVTDMQVGVYSRSGTQYTKIKTVGGTDPVGQVDVSGANRLELNYGSAKPILVNGYIAGDTNEIRFGWTGDKGVTTTHGLYVNSNTTGLWNWSTGKSGVRYNKSAHSLGLLVSNDTANTVKTTYNTLEDGSGGATFVGGVTLNSTLVVSGNSTFANSATFNGTVTMNSSLRALGGANYIGVGTATTPATNAGIIAFVSNGTTGTDGAFIEYFPPASGNGNTANILSITGALGNNLSQLNLKANTTTTSGVFKPYRLVLPVGANLYA